MYTRDSKTSPSYCGVEGRCGAGQEHSSCPMGTLAVQGNSLTCAFSAALGRGNDARDHDQAVQQLAWGGALRGFSGLATL